MNFIKFIVRQIRKSKIGRFLEFNFLSYLIWLIIRCISATVKICQVNFEKIKSLNKNVIYAFFHGEQFLLIFTHRHTNVVIMTSYSQDGELQTRILKKFGYDIVRGSTGKKGAATGTLSIIEKLLKGQDCAFAVDGPNGPGFKVKPGVVFLAQKTGLPIIPVRVFINKKFILNNWDKYTFPLPFSKAAIIYGEPFYVKETDNIEVKAVDLELVLKSIHFSVK